MAGREPRFTPRAAWPGGLWTPAQVGVRLVEGAQEGDPAKPASLISEGMILLVSAPIVFDDPGWGPVKFQLSIFRHFGDVLPEYEVVVE